MPENLEQPLKKKSGRGTMQNPSGRFESLNYFKNPDLASETPEDEPAPQTHFYKDKSKSVISTNNSPDVGFSASLNPYRGCEHGCIYCYARPTHEYFGFSAGLDFESKIMVKEDAPELLRRELASKSWKPQVLVMSGVTDCYQPVERHLKITRRCLQVLLEFKNPVAIITKNPLVQRDVDILAELARYQLAHVSVSVTSLDLHVAKVMEPRAGRPAHRLGAIKTLSQAGVPVNVMVAPVVPGLTDHEMPAILKAAAQAGAISAGYVLLRLPYGVKDLFENWLQTHFPEKKDKILGRLRAMRGGKLYDAQWGSRMSGQGLMAEQIQNIFEVTCRKLGLNQKEYHLSTQHFKRPEGPQLSLGF